MSHEDWDTQHSLFSTQSSTHITQTKFQLATLKKGFSTITEYINKATSLFSSLNAASHPLSPSEFTIYLLARLGFDYESIMTSITTRLKTLSTFQIFSYLLNHESRLAHQTHSLLSTNPISTNTTTTQTQSSSSSSNRGRGCGSYQSCHCGRGQGTSSSHACQVFHKSHHTALLCYHYFNQTYQFGPPSFLQAHYTTFGNLTPLTLN